MKIRTTAVPAILTVLISFFLPGTGLCFYNPNTGKWLSRDPIGEMNARSPYQYSDNDPMNKIDALGLYVISFHGDNWSFKDIDQVTWAFIDAKQGVGAVLQQIGEGKRLANLLPDCCAYKAAILAALKKISENVQKIRDGLYGDSQVDVYLESFTPTTALEVRGLGYYSQNIHFNSAASSTLNFFKYDPSQAAASLFHELSHFSRNGGTSDTAPHYWEVGPYYELLFKSDLKAWGTIMFQDIKSKTGVKGCKDPPWPYNN